MPTRCCGLTSPTAWYRYVLRVHLFAFGLIGFYDDYDLVVKNPRGLVARWNYFSQSVAGLCGTRHPLLPRPQPCQGNALYLPFVKNVRSSRSPPSASSALAYLMDDRRLPERAVNLTGGLDGGRHHAHGELVTWRSASSPAQATPCSPITCKIPEIRGAGSLS